MAATERQGPAVYVVSFDDLVSDTEGTMRDVATYLELEWDQQLCVPTSTASPSAPTRVTRLDPRAVISDPLTRYREILEMRSSTSSTASALSSSNRCSPCVAARHRPPYRPASPFPGPLAQPPQPVRLARKVCTAAVVYARDTQARARAARLGACRGHVLVGPWLSEVGFEVLYWIPMVRHLLARHQIDPGRVVALSRGGADGWYEGLAGRYLDALDWFTVDEVRQAREQHVALSGGEKQHRRGPFERILVARARETLGLDSVRVLHPSVMYDRFRPMWIRRRSLMFVHRQLEFAPLPRTRDPLHLEGLADDYVVVKAYFSDCFPDTASNRAFASALVARLAEQTQVVLLSTGLRIDNHREFAGESHQGVLTLGDAGRPRENLGIQTELIRGARALFSTYGGFSYLGPFVGTPTFAFYSDDSFNTLHLDVMRAAVHQLRAQHTNQAGAELTTFDIRAIPVLESILARSWVRA